VEPLLAFTHVAKTGGMALRDVARANLGSDAVVDLDATAWGPPSSWEQGLGQYRRYYESLSTDHRATVRCFLGHTAPLVIPAVRDRPIRAFCMLRDPVERVASLYLYGRWRADRLGVRLPATSVLGAMRRRGWETLKDVYRSVDDGIGEPGGSLEEPLWALFNGQARQLMMETVDPFEMPFTAAPNDLTDYRSRAFELLDRRYVVGTQERFSQSVRLFAESFGWRRPFAPRINVGRLAHATGDVDAETRDLISRFNRLDAQLHAHYQKRLDRLPPIRRRTDLRVRAGHRLRPRGWRTHT
jgi:hypothetical protein